MKLPRADEDALVSWRFVFTSILVCAIFSALVGWGFHWLISQAPWSPGRLEQLPSRIQTAMLFSGFMTFFITLMAVSMRFSPGRARLREAERQAIKMKIANYLTAHQDSKPAAQEFEIDPPKDVA